MVINFKEPTDKQVTYATAIAKSLGIKLPTVYSMSSYSDFIKDHKDEYRRSSLKKRIYKEESYSFLPERKFGDDMGEYVSEWLVQNLFDCKGIYAFLDGDEILYIGKSKNLADRIPSSYKERSGCGRINRIMYYITKTDSDTNILEIVLISENNPVLNKESNSHDESTLFKSNLSVLNDFSEIPILKED